MIVELCGWSPDQASMRQMFNDVGWATWVSDPDGDRWQMITECQIDEIGPITTVQGTYDENGVELTPPTIVGGHHWNIRFYGDAAKRTCDNFLTYDVDGNPVWNYAGIAATLEARMPAAGKFTEKTTKTAQGVHEGWELPAGHRLYNPTDITGRSRVWA